jgi:hypothetical protein
LDIFVVSNSIDNGRKQKFIYESPEKETAKNDTDIQDTISKILQVILGIIMAVLHM